jgi:hypothetical protein
LRNVKRPLIAKPWAYPIVERREWLEEQFRRLPFEPYAPVRSQLFGILREVNSRRGLARFEPVPSCCIRVRRCIVPPFEKLSEPGAPEIPKEAVA